MSEILIFNNEALVNLQEQLLPLTTFFAQAVRDPKVLDQIQASFKHFVDSGQVWALLIGLFLGYLFRSLF